MQIQHIGLFGVGFVGCFFVFLFGFALSFICCFPNVFLETQAEVTSVLQLYTFPLCGQWRQQNGSSQDGAFTLLLFLHCGVDGCMIQYNLQNFYTKATVSHS